MNSKQLMEILTSDVICAEEEIESNLNRTSELKVIISTLNEVIMKIADSDDDIARKKAMDKAAVSVRKEIEEAK